MMTDTLGGEVDFEALMDSDVDIDTLLDILSNSRRRFVLACLEEHETPMALSDIADELAIEEHDCEITEIAADDVKYVYLDLYHTHIPKMADAGVVEYSDERDAVALSVKCDDITSLVDLPLLS